MALYHKATITPSKGDLVADWVPTQPWCPKSDERARVVGAFRFDDPLGKVGMETHLVDVGGSLLFVPLVYREAPVDELASALIREIEHSALGTRWVYDGLGDPYYVTMLAAVSMTGQGEALGMVHVDDRWLIAPTNVRIRGGGWGFERVAVDGFEPTTDDPVRIVLQNDRFEMTVFRQPSLGEQPAMGLTATWQDQPDPVVLTEVHERS